MSEWVISSSLLIAAVIMLRAIFKSHIRPKLRYSLWLLVLIRLLLPINFGQSEISVLNHVPRYRIEQIVSYPKYADVPLNAGEQTEFEPYKFDAANNVEGTNQRSQHETERRIDAYKLMGIIYVSGALAVLAAIILSNLRLASKLKRSRHEAGNFMGLRVYKSNVLNTPCLFGLFKPSVYLSGDVEASKEKYVLIHEHAHYRQADHIWAVLRSIALALHWYNPLVWAAIKLSKQDGELSCDESVINSMHPDERLNYGQALITLSCAPGVSLLCTVTPLSSKGKKLRERIEYIAKKPSMVLGHMVLLLICAFAVAGCTFTGAKANEPSADSVETELIVSSTPSPTTVPFSESPAADKLSQPQLFDRNGEIISEEDFLQYDSAVTTFQSYIDKGYDVKLTLDLELQRQAKDILESRLYNSGEYGFSGCAVALDVKTGAPLAIVGMGEAIDPLTVSFTPHQLFLPCTGITALGEGLIDPNYKIKCSGVFDRYLSEGYAPECWMYQSYGLVHPDERMETALRDNCDYYFYTLGNDCGIDAIEKYANALGLGVASGIELPSGNGLMPSRKTAEAYGSTWNIGMTLEAAVGRSFCSFTPLQFAQYCSTIANNGTRYSASIVQEISKEGEVLYIHRPTVLNQITSLNSDAWNAVKTGLRSSFDFPINSFYNEILTNEGRGLTPLGEKLSGWEIAGKSTCTDGDFIFKQHLFMAYAPYDDPQIAVAVVTISTSESEPAEQIGGEIIAAYKAMKE